MSIDVRVETVTPTLAFKYLETNHDNRPLRQWRIDANVAIIKSGRWRVTHQGIAFHADGRLVDGQHRLWAVVLADQTVQMVVARGLSDEDVAAIDNGFARTYMDHAHYQGWQAETITAGMLRWMVGGIAYHNRPVPPDLLNEWYQFYEDGATFATEVYRKVRPAKKKITAPMAAALARAWYNMDQPLLDRFAAILHSGQREYEADNAAVALRDAWLAGRMGTPADQYLKTQGALRAFKDRRGIKTLQRPEGDVFPIPKLPKDVKYDAPSLLTRRLHLQERSSKA